MQPNKQRNGPELNCIIEFTLGKTVHFVPNTLLNDKLANLRSRLCSARTKQGEKKLFNSLSRGYELLVSRVFLQIIIMAYPLNLVRIMIIYAVQ